MFHYRGNPSTDDSIPAVLPQGSRGKSAVLPPSPLPCSSLLWTWRGESNMTVIWLPHDWHNYLNYQFLFYFLVFYFMVVFWVFSRHYFMMCFCSASCTCTLIIWLVVMIWWPVSHSVCLILSVSLCVSVSVCVSIDQWSPLNPEGKKQYDRNFMLQLRFEPSSVTRPANLPSLPDIILNEVTATVY